MGQIDKRPKLEYPLKYLPKFYNFDGCFSANFVICVT